MVHVRPTRDPRDESGIIIVLVALSLTVILALGALVIDIGNGRQTKRTAQSTADAAALAGAQDFLTISDPPVVPTDWNKVASSVQLYALQNMGIPYGDWQACTDQNMPTGYTSLYPSLSSGVDVGSCVSANSTSKPTILRVALPTRTVQTGFGRILKISSLKINAAAEAEITSKVTTTTAPGPLPCAICVLGTGTDQSPGDTLFEVNGNTHVDVSADSSTGIHVNASADAEGNSSITAPWIHLSGTAQGQIGNFVPVPTAAPSLSDPLDGMFTPPATTPDIGPSATEGIIDPGIYTDIIVGDGKTLTLSPGVYVVTGNMRANPQGVIEGSGVMVYFTQTASLEIGDQEELALTASTSGSYKGLVLWFDPLNASVIDLQAGGGLRLVGTLYAPAARLDLHGATTKVLHSSLVVKSLIIRGNGDVNVVYDSDENPEPPVTVKTTVKAPPNLYR